MTFSIIIVTYNQSFESIKITLKSVLCQSFKDYEIIISDDGSKENHFDEIENYLLENNFTNYKLIANQINQGTVKNLLIAVEAAEGMYIKDLGPDDLLYHPDTLKNLYDFMIHTRCEVSFGLMRGYYFNSKQEIVSFDYDSPFDIQAYRRNNSEERILKNLICYSDIVSGAAVCMKTAYALKYLRLLENVVIYVEDLYQVISSLEGDYLCLLDEYTVWYESRSGISNKGGKLKYSEKIRQDTAMFYNMIYELYPDNKYVNKRKKYGFLYKIKNLYIRTLIRFFINPDALRYIISHYIQVLLHRNGKKNRMKGFLDDEMFMKE